MLSKLDVAFNEKVSARGQLVMQLCLGLEMVLGLPGHMNLIRSTAKIYALGRPDVVTQLIERASVPALMLASASFLLGIKGRFGGLLFCLIWAVLRVLGVPAYQHNIYLLFLLSLVIGIDYHPEYSLRAFVSPVSKEPVGRSFVPTVARGQVLIVYGYTCLEKLTDPAWSGGLRGAALQAIVSSPSRPAGWMPEVFAELVARPHLRVGLAAAVILVEMALPFMLLVPRLRFRGLALGTAMHMTMQEVLAPGAFTFLMLIMYVAFLPSGDRAYQVSCRADSWFATHVRKWFVRLDWMGRTEWRVSSAASGGDSALDVRGPDGARWAGGWAALRLLFLSPALLVLYIVVSRIPMRPHYFSWSAAFAWGRNTAVVVVAMLWIAMTLAKRRAKATGQLA